MRHHDCSKPADSSRNPSVWLTLLAGVSMLAIMTAEPSYAQDEFAVDVSDPNVSVDLSVLDDGGIGPRMGAPLSATTPPSAGGAYQAPGPQAPVSTLYIQPSETFTLPPQTKTLIAEPAPQAMPDDDMAPDDMMAEDMTDEAQTDVVEEAPAPQEYEAEAVAEAEPEATPVPPAPEVAAPEIAAPEETAKAEPEPMTEPDVKAAPEPVQDVAKAEPAPAPPPAAQPEPTPAPAQDVAKAEPMPAPAPVPTPAPVAPVVEAAPQAETAEQTPPPPPQALTQPEAQPMPPAAIDETQTAPKGSGAVVVDLPPKLEEAQPGVASLPSATGPLADGDSMRIVFEHDSSKLPSDARDALMALSDRLSQQENLRLQLLAYAGGADTSASAARRLSLSRALAVRSYLIENGVRSTRIDVRALGNKSTEEVTERVDITVVER